MRFPRLKTGSHGPRFTSHRPTAATRRCGSKRPLGAAGSGSGSSWGVPPAPRREGAAEGIGGRRALPALSTAPLPPSISSVTGGEMSFQYVIKSGIQLERQIPCCSVLAVLLSGGTLEAGSTAGPHSNTF